MNNIVVTGVGLVTPLGSSREKTWANLIDGKNGIAKTPEGLEARIYDFSPNGARSRMGDFAVLATGEALRHAGFNLDEIRGRNIGCAVSQSKPILMTTPDPALLLASFFGWSSESVVKREFGLEGPSGNIVAACATGIASIQLGAHWIQSGQCDIAVAGAAESSLNFFYRSGFQQMGVLADECDGIRSPKPFDRYRSGFVMGEGAAVLVLESESFAQSRGAKPLARLLRASLGQSAHDPLRFDSDGSAVARLISQTTNGFDSPGYINAHGTGTLVNDVVETRGIKKSLGKSAWRIPISSTKAATGHLLGAAGAVEAAFSVLALRDQVVPPTLNFSQPDSECDLDYVPGKSRPAELDSTLSLSYGFGGQMGAVLFGRC